MTTVKTAPSGSHPSTLRFDDVAHLGSAGLRARPARALLSAVGIAIGIAAMIAVVGVSASSQARLNEQLASLGTNLLTAKAGDTLFGDKTDLPAATIERVERMSGVLSASGTTDINWANVYRSELINEEASGGISVKAAHRDLLTVTGAAMSAGVWLNAATEKYPTVVLGRDAAARLGVASTGTRVWLGGEYFTVVGILKPVPLAPELDIAALIGEPIARELLGAGDSPSVVYERSDDASVASVRERLPRSINPEAPEEVAVSRPSDALAAKDATDQAFTGLLVGLGSVSLLVGGIGVANTMIISVLERRREIGLRRALGATRSHIRLQFLAEALLLSAMGGVMGTALGIAGTAVFAGLNGWPLAIPAEVVGIAVGATLLVGAAAGIYPAVRAARTPPTAALNS